MAAQTRRIAVEIEVGGIQDAFCRLHGKVERRTVSLDKDTLWALPSDKVQNRIDPACLYAFFSVVLWIPNPLLWKLAHVSWRLYFIFFSSIVLIAFLSSKGKQGKGLSLVLSCVSLCQGLFSWDSFSAFFKGRFEFCVVTQIVTFTEPHWWAWVST